MTVRFVLATIVGAALLATIVGAALLAPPAASAQVTIHPSNRPVVTAEHEAWYLDGDPITWSGSFYYPAGAEVFFERDEMVRSGSYGGIPIYVRTTVEPSSVVFVPVAGGLMQPYERRRAGEVAGTVGSFAPSFPVQRDFEVTGDAMAQAAAPGMLTDRYYDLEPFDGRAPFAVVPKSAMGQEPPAPAIPLMPMRSALLPQGLNAFYIDYDNTRWFNSGRAEIADPATLIRTGDYKGFTVYTSRESGPDTIYVPVAHTAESLMTPYTRKE